MISVRSLLMSALRYCGGTHGIADIERGLLDKRYQLWTGKGSVIVTEIERYPRRTICNMFLGAGEVIELDKMRRSIETWAAEQGCDAIRLYGRQGWPRLYRKAGLEHGYRTQSVTFEKELTHG